MTGTESFWLKDMIVLGQGAPNQISKIGGQQGRCLCLWSDKTGFVRVYPVPHGYVHDWEVINVEVRKPTNIGGEAPYFIPTRRGKNVYYKLSNPKIIDAFDIIREVLYERLKAGRHGGRI